MKIPIPLAARLSVTAILFAAPLLAKAQTGRSSRIRNPAPTDIVSLGVGVGLDYGGIGMNLNIYPQKNIGIFGGVGYAFVGIGYNAGIKARILLCDLQKPSPAIFLIGMYGHNTIYRVKDAPAPQNMFAGPTIGLGFETALKSKNPGYWSFAILLPLRSSEALNYYDDLIANRYGATEQKLLPVAFSIGYKFAMDRTQPLQTGR